MKKNKKKNNQGYTLIEMIVSVGIFAIVSVLIAQLFVIFSQTQQKSTIQQQIQGDARVVLAQVSDRIRSGIIDYASYGVGISSPTDQLYLIDENGISVLIEKSSSPTECPSAESTPCLVISENGGAPTPMSSDKFTVDIVQFYIDPSTDPEPSSGPDIQPRVTMTIGITGVNINDALKSPTYIQTTASSRVYLR